MTTSPEKFRGHPPQLIPRKLVRKSTTPRCWMRLDGETRTLAVSLEAIFLSTFVLIGQNRQAAFQQTKADHDFRGQELELHTNTELTRQIHVLTKELHRAPGPGGVAAEQMYILGTPM